MKGIPSTINSTATLTLVKSGQNKPADYFNSIKEVTDESDEKISDWLSINVKSFKSYQKQNQKSIKPLLMEHIIMLLSLFKHGHEIFDSVETFKLWLEKPNFYFDQKAPVEFIDTISGIKFVNDRLTALEYGDNS